MTTIDAMYRDLADELKVMAVIALAEKQNRGNPEYRGMSFAEIKRGVREHYPDISTHAIAKGGQILSDLGHLSVSKVIGDENIGYTRIYALNGSESRNFAEYILKKIGWTEDKIVVM